jgi:hypothetical protein
MNTYSIMSTLMNRETIYSFAMTQHKKILFSSLPCRNELKHLVRKYVGRISILEKLYLYEINIQTLDENV